jgi:hypothetical protein
MSTWMGVRLREGQDGAPALVAGCGQNISLRCRELDGFARDLGLTPLSDFIVDHCGLVEQAWEEAVRDAGWQRPLATERPLEPGEGIPIIPFEEIDDPAYRAEVELWGRVVEDVDRNKPWFDPAEGLATVRGLIRHVEERLNQSDLRDVARLVESDQFGPDRWHLHPTDPERVRWMNLIPSLWDLRGFETLLSFAERRPTRFHLGVSY